MMRGVVACVAICLISAGLAARQTTTPSQQSAQSPSQTPVFRGRIDLARVDVTVIDNKTGKPVGNLTERDFTITENGVRQSITAFSPELLAASPAPQAAPSPAVRGSSAAPRNRRIFLIVLGEGAGDLGGIQRGPVKPYEGALRFIREKLLPQDLVAVLAYNRATDFTTNHEQAAQLVERLQIQRDVISFDIFKSVDLRFGKHPDLPPDVQSTIDALFDPPGSTGQPARNTTSMLLGTAEFREADDRPTQRAWNRMVAGLDLLKIYAGIEYLRPLDGEKHLICLTNGMYLPLRVANLPAGLFLQSTEDDVRLAVRANDAQVAIDIIHTTGVDRGQAFEIMASQHVSNLTGGQFTGVRTADAALARIDEATRVGYVLGYTPSNPALDGRFRNVDVKVNRRDVTVVFRRGYTAQTDATPLNLREVVTGSRLLGAAATDVEVHDIKLQVTAAASGPRQVRVDLKIDASRLTLQKNGDKYEGTVDLVILCGDDRQKAVGTLKQQMHIGMDEAHYDIAMQSGIPYIANVPVTAAATFVKVLAYDYGADLIGTAVVRLK